MFSGSPHSTRAPIPDRTQSHAGEIPLLAPDPEHQRDQTATAATTKRYAVAYPVAEEKTQDAHRATLAATGLPGPRIDVTNWPAQRHSPFRNASWC
jgi:hypothetical protein